MKYDEIRLAWNAQADDEKQWNSLTEAEKIEWAASAARPLQGFFGGPSQMHRRFGGYILSPQMEPGSAGRCICDGECAMVTR